MGYKRKSGLERRKKSFFLISRVFSREMHSATQRNAKQSRTPWIWPRRGEEPIIDTYLRVVNNTLQLETIAFSCARMNQCRYVDWFLPLLLPALTVFGEREIEIERECHDMRPANMCFAQRIDEREEEEWQWLQIDRLSLFDWTTPHCPRKANDDSSSREL